MQSVQYNEAMHTLIDDFSGKYRRINDLMNAFRGVRCLPLISQLIDKFCQVVVPYSGGPILAHLMEHYMLNWGTSNPSTNWGVAIDLDRGVSSTDVIKLLLDDIEESFEEISGESSDSEDRNDYRLIVNIMAALGFPTAVVPEVRVKEDFPLWSYLQFYDLFCFYDTKGAGQDTAHYHPVAADVDAQIHRAFPAGYACDFRDWIGFWPNASKSTEHEAGADNIVYGIMRPGAVAGDHKLAHRVYTSEDGWFSTIGSLDLTAADTLQDYIWSMPWVTKHIFGAMAISSEDPEEEYFIYGANKLANECVLVHDHLGEGYYIALQKKEFGGFDVPVIH
jgi:hypothetical protein